MNQGSGFLLIIIGLLLLYTLITGKFKIIETAFYQLFDMTPPVQTPGSQKTETSVEGPNIGAGTGEISLPRIFIPNYTQP